MGSKGAKYDEGAAMRSQEHAAQMQAKYGTYGVNSALGNMGLTQNADGTYSLNYSMNDSDKMRQSLVNQGLASLSLNPQQAQQAYYKQATSQLLPQFQTDQDRLHEQLINRGITEGSSLYNDQMNLLRQNQNNQLSNIANQAVYEGQNYLGSQIGNIGSLASQYDLLNLPSMSGNTGASFNSTYNNKYASDVQNSQAKNQMWNSIGSLAGSAIGGAAAILSDKRLKENIKPVGKLDNGLTVYLFNYIGQKTPQIGLIAQEVQKVIPEAVTVGEDGFLRVDYARATKE